MEESVLPTVNLPSVHQAQDAWAVAGSTEEQFNEVPDQASQTVYNEEAVLIRLL